MAPDDVAAGLTSLLVPRSASGRLTVVPGRTRPSGAARVQRVRVEVEKGLDVDGAIFARFVLATLSDPRSWGRGRRIQFVRTDGSADLRVVLASPATSARLCAPLRTNGRLSCARRDVAVLTLYRWVKGTPDYGDDTQGYRRYLVNHEVGHLLGHSHQTCPGRGRRAPIMQQQTKGLFGCRKNSWPYPQARR